MNIRAILKLFNELSPGNNEFYSSLNRKRMNDKEYQHVFAVWNKFEMKIMKYCHYWYLKFDVSLLADIFEKLEIDA